MVSNDTINNLAHPVIAGATGTVLATNDHTTQLLAVLVQVVSLILVFLRGRKAQNL